MTRIKVVIRTEMTEIYSPFGARELIKTIPARKWDVTRKIWIVPTVMLLELRTILAAWPGGVDYLDDRKPTPTKPTTDWAGAMFTALPAPLRKPAYRALSRVLHPDTGGDTQQMQLLNNAWTKTGAPT